ncbi:MAG: C1 family peptidase [Bergeyella zoohelcum]|nr:C1 family peptidase [Bergeyella zoohelcum]
MKKRNAIAVVFLSLSGLVSAQDNLINSLKNNHSEDANFKFTTIKEVGVTSVKNQGSSGTCWSYSGNSFLESEMIKNGQEPVDLAEIFTARMSYYDKAKRYVLYNGKLNWGEGGELHDVINMYKKYGALPQEAYSGLKPGQQKNDFKELQAEIKPVLDSLVEASSKHKLSDNWLDEIERILDKHLGKVPQKFTYKGKEYTPKTFASQVVKLNSADYLELTSYKDYPYYERFVVPVPDNWSQDTSWNVPMKELTEIIDYSIAKGYSVGWATDVSEPYFSYKNGVAYVPDIDLDNITPEIKKDLFTAPKPDKTITEEMRQKGLNNLSTTDDHGMQIVGIAKDQNGKEYYIVKNSWGTTNDFDGYLYVTKPYVLYKSTAILVNKNGVPKSILKKLKPNTNLGF